MVFRINHKVIIVCVLLAFSIVSLLYYIRGNDNELVYLNKFNQMFSETLGPPFQHLLLNSFEEPQQLDAMQTAFEKEQSNLPFRYWLDKAGPLTKPFVKHNNNSCGNFPNLVENLKLHNIHWQTFQHGNIVFRLYSCHYDNRENILERPIIRMLLMSNQAIGPFPSSYCQFWYHFNESSNGNMKIMPVDEITQLWDWSWPKNSNDFYPYMLTCALPDKQIIPQAVSLITNYCENATNSLRVGFEPPPLEKQPENFAICVQDLNIENDDKISAKWLELHWSIGVSKIFMYSYGHNASINNVLEYSKTRDIVEVRSFSFGTSLAITPFFTNHILKYFSNIRIAHEIIAYNDCFYRHMYQYKYIIMLDNYDVLTSLGKVIDWISIFQNINYSNEIEEKICGGVNKSICLSVYDEKYHNTALPAFRIIKCLYNTKSVIAVHNNLPLYKTQGCHDYILPQRIAQILNFKDLLVEDEKKRKITNDHKENFTISFIKQKR